MAVVLPSEERNYFRHGSLRRTPSQSSFTGDATHYRPSTSTSTSRNDDAYTKPSKPLPESASSSVSSSPRTAHTESTDPSCVSTPATNYFTASEFEETLGIDEAPEDHFTFPSLSQDKFFTQEIPSDDSLEPPPSPRNGHSYPVSPDDQDSSDTTRPGTPECGEHAEDDSAVATRPSRQVDYLSHDWTEEDIWSSWRYIVTRRDEFSNSARLENAAWRTWTKTKNNLKTISPETLNWLKDCDVTWLYGPLQTGHSRLYSTQTEPSSVSLSKSGSSLSLNKKPILKKRTVSELMLQRSLSSASLLKQATAAVRAQETRPKLVRSSTDYMTLPLRAWGSSSEDCSTGLRPSTESSGLSSPSAERKHIHFNEQVEQCIAVEVKGEEDDDMEVDQSRDESDSDGVVMKRMKSKRRKPIKRRGTGATRGKDGKIIAMLPSTTLKYRSDTPDPPETAMKHSTGVFRSPVLSPSSSQETLRPTRQANGFFFGDEEDEMDEAILNSKAGWRSPPTVGSSLQQSSSDASDDPVGMRRTPSGMFMPYDEDETAYGDGIFSRVVDTVNTARDIAHVIWNVGWRK